MNITCKTAFVTVEKYKFLYIASGRPKMPRYTIRPLVNFTAAPGFKTAKAVSYTHLDVYKRQHI